jgi:hypothetical protein
VFGFPEPGGTEFDPETRVELLSAGFSVLTTAHALSAGERALSSKFGGAYPLEIVANTLRLFGQGTKVAVEVATMALDAGLIPYGRPVIALGGTNNGLDTALVIVPAGSARLFDTKILDVVARPTTF